MPANAVNKTRVHLFSGFLGVGKTTALKSLMAQKDPAEKWVIIVNEFGEIGIDDSLRCLWCVRGRGVDAGEGGVLLPR